MKTITQNIHTNIRKNENQKLNRTMESSIQTKKQKELSNSKNLRENEPIKAPKKEDKDLKSIGRRVSLTALSFSSTT